MKPFAMAIGDNFILMQDNACPHTAGVCMDYHNCGTIEVIDWPAHSPDLNPKEHGWDILYRHVSRHDHPPMNFKEFAIILNEWETLAL